MALEDGRRKLVAIVFTDIEGYTSIVQKDEQIALGLLEEHNAILRSVLRQHHGREVKTVGDAFLIEFESALEAVLCGIEIQSAMKERNDGVPGEKQIFLRIGVHIGDVVYRGNDILGDAVNIASRIQSEAEPGTVNLSEDVYNQIRNKINYTIEKIPKQKFKNIQSEINVYRILLPWEKSGDDSRHIMKNRIAVIPFANISPDPNDDYFTDGLTEELISTLSEIRGLRVIARTSVLRYRGTDRPASAIGKDLSVAYILEGSVRKAGSKIRVTAQLIDCRSEERVWSDRYDRKLDDLFAIQSDIAKSVAVSLKITLLSGDMARVEKRDTDNVAAYAAYLKGRTYLHERTEKAIKAAREQFLIATKEDPAYARAYAGIADTHMLLGDYLFAPVPESLDLAKKYIDKALDLDPDIAEARVSLGNYLVYDYKFNDAEVEFKRAIALNPSYATGHHWYGNLLEHLGRPEESLAEILLAEKLDPLSSSITISAVYSCIQAGKLDEANRRITKLKDIDAAKEYIDEAKMVVHFVQRNWSEASRYLQRMLDRDPNDPFLKADAAYIDAVRGNRSSAMKTIGELEKLPPSARTRCGMIAFVYIGLGEIDESIAWLNRAVDERETFFGWFRLYPLFEVLWRDPRFQRILRRANLPATNEGIQATVA
jgi:adenylate cyclase